MVGAISSFANNEYTLNQLSFQELKINMEIVFTNLSEMPSKFGMSKQLTQCLDDEIGNYWSKTSYIKK